VQALSAARAAATGVLLDAQAPAKHPVPLSTVHHAHMVLISTLWQSCMMRTSVIHDAHQLTQWVLLSEQRVDLPQLVVLPVLQRLSCLAASVCDPSFFFLLLCGAHEQPVGPQVVLTA